MMVEDLIDTGRQGWSDESYVGSFPIAIGVNNDVKLVVVFSLNCGGLEVVSPVSTHHRRHRCVLVR